ncbi:MAG TPA: fumarylacetoacetate hydrolase family protein [Burkholderiaceae bacterium]|nr:fumarylacetoacetate hydrolase family protein [Burkholderiaceae bacterium]
MKLISFAHRGNESWGAVVDQGVVDLGRRLPAFPTLRTLLEADALPQAGRLAVAGNADVALADVTLRRPIPYPEKIVCVGVNYADRNEEYKDGANAPKYASLFIRFPDSLVAHGETIVRPPESEQLDYEGEIVIVVGQGGRRISQARAHEHIAGLTIMNEGTIRDWLRHGKFNVTQGKNFVASGAVGPWIVTADECPPFTDLNLTTRVNGEVRQHDNTSRMAFPFAHLIHYISTFMLLKPGDLIATGTPTGAGARFDPPKWLKAGDRVEVTVDGVGTLSNPIADETAR